MHAIEETISYQAVEILPIRKKIDAAILLGPTDVAKTYQAAAEIFGQFLKATEKGYQYDYCFVFLNLECKDDLEEAVDFAYAEIKQLAQIRFVNAAYLDNPNVNLAIHLECFYPPRCQGSYTIYTRDESLSKKIQSQLTEHEFCGNTFIPFEPSDQEKINSIDTEIREGIQDFIQNDE